MVTLICGLPNSGKTTYSRKYDNVIHLDDVGHKVFDAVKESNDDVVVEGIFILRSTRTKLLKAYNGDGKRICVWLDVSPEECERRENRNRAKYAIWNCHSVFEPPTLDEGWDEIIIIRGDDNVERINREKQT